VIAGATRASRVEPRFGRLASALAGKPLQVRGWSRGEWAHLMQEKRAYTNGQLGDGTLAFAGIGGGCIDVGAAVCLRSSTSPTGSFGRWASRHG
jgi:hypothetical protein